MNFGFLYQIVIAPAGTLASASGISLKIILLFQILIISFLTTQTLRPSNMSSRVNVRTFFTRVWTGLQVIPTLFASYMISSTVFILASYLI